jgi:hypothetical protein
MAELGLFLERAIYIWTGSFSQKRNKAFVGSRKQNFSPEVESVQPL